MVTSSAVVGSSAMSRAGPEASAMAIMARWRRPPESWCGKSRARWSGEGIWTRSSISIVRAQASRRPAPLWARMAEAIWSPIEKTGLSDVIGSWKIMAMRAPRTRRMASASLARRSSPSKRTRPAATRPGGGTSRMIDSDVTLLPQPLSPTSPSTSPRSIEKLTPSTARSTPSPVSKWVWRPSTESSGAMSEPEPGVEGVAQPVAEEIDGEDGQHDREPRKGREPPRRGDVVPSVGEHPAPGGRGRLDAQPQEGQRRLVDDHERQLERGHDDDRGEGVRQHVAEEQAHRPVAAGTGAADELPLPDRQHVGAHDAGELHPSRHGHHQDHVDQAWAQREDDAHREQDVRNGQEDVHDTHDQGVGARAVEARKESQRDADQAGERHRGETHAEGDPAAVEDAAQEVTAEVIGAQRMLAQAARLPGGRAEALEEHLAPRIPRGDLRGQERRAAHAEEHRDPEHRAEAHAAPACARHGPDVRRHRRARGLVHGLARTNTMRGSR